jgi:hypothetical protein
MCAKVRYHCQVEAGRHPGLVNACFLRPNDGAYVAPPQLGRRADRLRLGAVGLANFVAVGSPADCQKEAFPIELCVEINFPCKESSLVNGMECSERESNDSK